MAGDLLLIHCEPLNSHSVLVDQAVWTVELVAAVIAVSVTIANLVLSNTVPTVTVKRSCVKKIRETYHISQVRGLRDLKQSTRKIFFLSRYLMAYHVVHQKYLTMV